MRFTPVVSLLCSAIAAMATPARAEDPRSSKAPAPQPAPDPIVGYWAFFPNNVTEVRKDGELTSSNGLGGKWECISAKEAERKYKFVWEGGRYGGTLILSRDRQTLSGTNQSGRTVSAKRIRGRGSEGAK